MSDLRKAIEELADKLDADYARQPWDTTLADIASELRDALAANPEPEPEWEWATQGSHGQTRWQNKAFAVAMRDANPTSKALVKRTAPGPWQLVTDDE